MANEIKDNDIRDLSKFDPEIFDNISTLIENQEKESVITLFAGLHSADIAEIINHLNLDDATYAFRLLDPEIASEVVTELDDNIRENILTQIEPQEIADIVDNLDTDDATDIVSELPDQLAEDVLNKIDKEYSRDVKKLLKYPEDSAGGIMNSDFVFVHDDATVGDAIEEIRKNADELDHIYYIYVLDNESKLVGIVTIKSVLIHTLDTKIETIMERDLIYVTTDIDQEEVARMIDKYDLIAIPVVDDNRVMLGRITFDDVVDVMQEEASEDLQRVAGLSEDEEFTDSAFKISRNRLPWLFFGLFGELISAVVLSSFEASIQQIVVASFFIPIVMAMGGSSGTQAAIVMVSNITESDYWISDSIRRVFKEFRVALLNATACGILLLLGSHFFFHTDLAFSAILTVSLFIVMTNATMLGAVIPIFLKRLGVDPAIATGPFVSTTNDIVGLLIYLTLISIFLVH